jgi:hypothetical protein
LHWGKPETVLGYSMIEPTLLHIGGILTPSSPSLAELLGSLMPTAEGARPPAAGPFQLLAEALKALEEKK